MTLFQRISVISLLFAVPMLYGQLSESAITNQIQKLRSLPTNERPAATIKLANDVRLLPAGLPKLRLADTLAHLVTEGDQGSEALQAVADTLAKSLSETRVPSKNGQPPMPYFDLANLVRYDHANATLDDPLFAKANEALVADEAEIQKADFTLKDLHNKKVTLSQLRGNIVLVNFWATWCPPCRLEMPDLDIIYTTYKSQGLVVLSITDDDEFKVASMIKQVNYHPTVLLDPSGAVHKQFHIEGIPKTFVFGRDGKLVGEAIDQCTQRQFFGLLAAAGLQPQ